MAVRPAVLTYGNVLDVAGRKFPGMLQDNLSATILNLTTSKIWDAYDWRWSLDQLPPFYLMPNQQDYGAPAVTIPDDFYGLRFAQLIQTNATPPVLNQLMVIKDLLITNVRYIPHAICYAPDVQAFRIFPRMPDNLGSPTYMINGRYKTLPPKVTTANLATTLLPSDDEYFQMWVETAKYIAYQLDGDPRAGQIAFANGQVSATGQAAVMRDMIMWAAEREGLELGDVTISPAEPLVVGIGNYSPSNLGFGFPGF